MAEGLEIGADMATAGLIARAAEAAGGHGGGHHDGQCLNCGTALIGAHCHACGQAAHVHRTAGAILHDISHAVFHFEGKAWRTLPMLLRHPGELTRRYIDGERARFVSPLALFLFSVFLMFAIVANLPGWTIKSDLLGEDAPVGMGVVREKLEGERVRTDNEVTRLTKRLAKARALPEPDAEDIATTDRKLVAARDTQRELTAALAALPTPDPADAAKAKAEKKKSDSFGERLKHARENPKLLFYKVKMSAYKFSWALIPLSLPFLWLLFPFSRRFGLYDHAVFATYSLTFMSLLVITLAVLNTIGLPGGWLVLAGLVIAPFHIYRQLKGAYGLSRRNALARTSLLLMFIICGIVPLATLGLLYLGVAD